MKDLYSILNKIDQIERGNDVRFTNQSSDIMITNTPSALKVANSVADKANSIAESDYQELESKYALWKKYNQAEMVKESEVVNEVTPPGMSEKLMRKLKKQYRGNKAKAYATAWDIYNKQTGKVDEDQGVAEGFDNDTTGPATWNGHRVVANRRTPKGDFLILQNKNDSKYEIHRQNPNVVGGLEFVSVHKTPDEMQSVFKKLTGIDESNQGVAEGWGESDTPGIRTRQKPSQQAPSAYLVTDGAGNWEMFTNLDDAKKAVSKLGYGTIHKGGKDGPIVSENWDMSEDTILPKDEGDERTEVEMTSSQLNTIEDAVEELRSILDADEDIPEWVQSKITIALDHLDTARDYMASVEDDSEKDDMPDTGHDASNSKMLRTKGSGLMFNVYENKKNDRFKTINSMVDSLFEETDPISQAPENKEKKKTVLTQPQKELKDYIGDDSYSKLKNFYEEDPENVLHFASQDMINDLIAYFKITGQMPEDVKSGRGESQNQVGWVEEKIKDIFDNMDDQQTPIEKEPNGEEPQVANTEPTPSGMPPAPPPISEGKKKYRKQ